MDVLCRICKIILNINDNWSIGFKNNSQYICKTCERNRKQKYKKIKIVKIKQTNKEINLKRTIKNYSIKEEIIKKYGEHCECCKIDIWQFLTIDHINNDGAAHRKIIKRKGIQFYKWLKANNYPKDNYRLLCNNCNSSYGHNGFCIHSLNNNKNSCSFCNLLLNSNNTFDYYLENNINICKECVIYKAIKINNINKKSSLKKMIWSKLSTIKTKLAVIKGYGNNCVCCGENNYPLLTIDHINNGGTKIRKETKIFGVIFYRWLINNNFPSEYRLLCYNCNSCRGAYGKCYHELCKDLNKSSISIDEYKDIILNKENKCQNILDINQL